jgi:hypothetical protein
MFNGDYSLVSKVPKNVEEAVWIDKKYSLLSSSKYMGFISFLGFGDSFGFASVLCFLCSVRPSRTMRGLKTILTIFGTGMRATR